MFLSGPKDAFWWEGRFGFFGGFKKRTGGESPHGKKTTAGRFVQFFSFEGLILYKFAFTKVCKRVFIQSDFFPLLYVEESRHAQTVFRDKSGKKRNLDAEREEQRKKDEEKAAKDEKYAQWGKGYV